jgi:hypothetical protein
MVNQKHKYGVRVTFSQISPEGDQYNEHSWQQNYSDHEAMIEAGFAVDELLTNTLRGMMKEIASEGIKQMRQDKDKQVR